MAEAQKQLIKNEKIGTVVSNKMAKTIVIEVTVGVDPIERAKHVGPNCL